MPKKSVNTIRKKIIVPLFISLFLINIVIIFIVIFFVKTRSAGELAYAASIQKGLIYHRQEDGVILRGIFGSFVKNQITIWVGRDFDTDRRTVTLDKDTLFGCVPKTYIDNKGQKIDRRTVFVNMKNYIIPNPGLVKSKWLKGRDWFIEKVDLGDIVEAWYYKIGSKRVYAVFIIADNC